MLDTGQDSLVPARGVPRFVALTESSINIQEHSRRSLRQLCMDAENRHKTVPSESFKGFDSRSPSNSKGSKLADAVRDALGNLSSHQGRIANTTNIVFGDESEEKWRELDNQVNEYPGQRTFKAIGSGGVDFVKAMVGCVAAEVGAVHEECVSSRTKGKWISVTVGPVWVETPEQVLNIYNAMKADGRLRFFI